MTDKPATDASSTEAMPSKTAWLDNLDDGSALQVMLDSHSDASQAIAPVLANIADAAQAMTARLKATTSPGRIIYIGAGTSARIAVQDGAELPPTFGWDKTRLAYVIAGGVEALLSASEGSEDDSQAAREAMAGLGLGQHDVVIGLSASGTTPFTVAGIEAASKADSLTIGIANNADSALLRVAAHPILLASGGEVVAGSTRLKAATAQKICLNMLSTLVMTRLGFVRHGLMSNMTPTSAKLQRRKAKIDAVLAGKGVD